MVVYLPLTLMGLFTVEKPAVRVSALWSLQCFDTDGQETGRS